MPQATAHVHVRAITPEALHTFTAIPAAGADPEVHARLQAHLAGRWASGRSRPEWCFVAEQQGRVVGRLAFWVRRRESLPRAPTRHIDPLLLDLPWEGDYLAVGAVLLRHGLAAMRREGAEEARFVGYTPSELDALTAQRLRELLEGEGWALEKETLEFEWVLPEDGMPARPSRRLVYRALEEVGAEAFIDAIRVVTRETLDRLHRRAVDEVGPERQARHLFEDALRGSWQVGPELWELAYTPGGTLVGLLMPAVTRGERGTLAYIGVAPDRRGRRHVDELLDRATRRLARAGVRRIVNETDAGNWPLADAFRRAGHARIGTSVRYRVSLAEAASR
jgi:ribosomal protein S18 acetylase RimI-like enzyme